MDDIRSDDWKRVVQELRRELFGGTGCPTDPDLPLVPFILTVTKKGEHIPMYAYDRTVAFMKVAVEKGAVSLEKGTSNKGKQSRHAHLVGIVHIERDDRMKTIVTDACKAFFPIRCARTQHAQSIIHCCLTGKMTGSMHTSNSWNLVRHS
jgi:hypothetical protein